MPIDGACKTITTDTISAPVQTVEKGLFCAHSDLLAVEEPLQLCLNGSPLSITMRSPGSDLDLATGFLLTEGIIDDIAQILSMRAESVEDGFDDSSYRVTIRLKP
jgi:FdhD protein